MQIERFSYDQLRDAAESSGLACRGGFHPTPEDGVPAMAVDQPARTVVLLGFTGALQWPHFTLSPEYRDGEPHPLDRWSRRIVGALARRFGARELYPDTGPPWWPFQRWARRAEALHVSPLGILIHPEFGLWHAYRGALLFAQALEVAQMHAWPHPCERCAGKPCLSSCPVGALAPARFERAVCMAHVGSASGGECRSRGCLARRSCPVGAAHGYGPEQAAFHMRASLETFTWERR